MNRDLGKGVDKKSEGSSGGAGGKGGGAGGKGGGKASGGSLINNNLTPGPTSLSDNKATSLFKKVAPFFFFIYPIRSKSSLFPSFLPSLV
jgi:hypothetical protein